MKKSKIQQLQKESLLDFLEQQYQAAENKEEIDYWSPISKIILESIELRNAKGMSQSTLANKMNTRQSVISRFENMGRIPSYDLIARISRALDNSPGITLYGDFMAIVPHEKQDLIRKLAREEMISTKELVQNILEQSIAKFEQIKRIDIDPSLKLSSVDSNSIIESSTMFPKSNIQNLALADTTSTVVDDLFTRRRYEKKNITYSSRRNFIRRIS